MLCLRQRVYWIHSSLYTRLFILSLHDELVSKYYETLCISKSKRGYNFTHMPTPPELSAATIFCMCWGRTVDIITHARFQLNQFRGLGAPGAENDHPPLNWHIALTTMTTVYALTCYTVIKIVNFRNL